MLFGTGDYTYALGGIPCDDGLNPVGLQISGYDGKSAGITAVKGNATSTLPMATGLQTGTALNGSQVTATFENTPYVAYEFGVTGLTATGTARDSSYTYLTGVLTGDANINVTGTANNMVTESRNLSFSRGPTHDQNLWYASVDGEPNRTVDVVLGDIWRYSQNTISSESVPCAMLTKSYDMKSATAYCYLTSTYRYKGSNPIDQFDTESTAWGETIRLAYSTGDYRTAMWDIDSVESQVTNTAYTPTTNTSVTVTKTLSGAVPDNANAFALYNSTYVRYETTKWRIDPTTGMSGVLTISGVAY